MAMIACGKEIITLKGMHSIASKWHHGGKIDI
jgi:hypothetical protein